MSAMEIAKKRADTEKKAIHDYLTLHGIEPALQQVVNSVVKDKPEDPLWTIGDQFRALSAKAKRGILKLEASELFDSQGHPTLEIAITSCHGEFRALCSNHSYKAVRNQSSPTLVEDSSLAEQFGGGKMATLVKLINENIAAQLVGRDPTQQLELDNFLLEKSADLGSHATAAISMAICRAGAAAKNAEIFQYVASLSEVGQAGTCLPVPVISIINGGNFGGTSSFIQDICIIPVEVFSLEQALQLTADFVHHVTTYAETKGSGYRSYGTHGGLCPPMDDADSVLRLLHEALELYAQKDKIRFHIDMAASQFALTAGHLDEGDPALRLDEHHSYDLDRWNGSSKGFIKESPDLADLYKEWLKKYPAIISLQDPFASDDWSTYSKFITALDQIDIDAAEDQKRQIVGGDPNCKLQIIGNELIGSRQNLEKAMEEHSCNTMLLDIMKVGTISEGIRWATLARSSGWGLVVGGRGAESEDHFIADFAVGVRAGMIATGGLTQSQHVSKINQLLRISRRNDRPVFISGEFRKALDL